jgi:hypothetical protein
MRDALGDGMQVKPRELASSERIEWRTIEGGSFRIT